ncbi:predicted protein [Streptomyces viridochromogenes DSM 40736]|uniref:Predicted protein n=1 Tax=Streptomyces viridochromogenes (strain DSM 40736 / JCM 4977 / BCRC 1201 / Tue 494) TaxID=591159 RepID=D9X9I1_STRVT|nr:hypothetical protein [Streptomyces viridochromogenes]EFL32182.1 predicted protein [Streptomyces viridochromogenes DSM 40736]
MRKLKVLGSLVGAALAMGALATAPASAAAGDGGISVKKVQRGSVTCFNYSWGDDGIASYTVYYHNTCAGSHGLYVTTNAGLSHECIWVGGGKKGSHVFYTPPIKFEHKKTC